MRHRHYEEWLQLALYDELSEQERALFDTHLTSCKKCQMEFNRMKEFAAIFAQRKPADVSETLLQDARRNLRVQLQLKANRRSLFRTIKDAMDDLLSPPFQVALGGAAMLAIGILAGYFVFKSTSEKSLMLQQTGSLSSMMEAGESQITNVHFLDRDTQTGNVEFTFETVTPVRIRGNVNDENVQKVLARALVSNQNAGVRLRAVNIIGNQADQKRAGTTELDKEIKSALIMVLLHDPNLGVRKEALQVFRNYLPDTVIVHAFLSVLANEKNTSLKIVVINSLDLTKDQNQPVSEEIQAMLRHKVQSDDNTYIKIRAKAALQEVKQ